MADAHFLIIAERQAVLRAGLEPFLLQEEIVRILIENGAEARIHAGGFLEGLIVAQIDRLGGLGPLAILAAPGAGT